MSRALTVIFVVGLSTLFRVDAGGADAAVDVPEEWRLIGNNAEQQHYSPDSQITDRNVAQLGIAWYFDYPTPDGTTGVPLVANGLVFQSGALGRVFANNVRDGKLVWSYDAQIRFPLGVVAAWGSRETRGVALWGDEVITATGDCRVIALDQRSGSKRWEVQSCDPAVQTITGAPRVGGDEIFVGNANADSNVGRGYVDAFDAQSGAHRWRFYTMPGDPSRGFESKTMEMAAKTWGEGYWKLTGGASPWDGLTYDPQTGLLYIGTDGASPWPPPSRGKNRGDELFTTSIIAVNAKTGEYVWHYQTTPDDAWNFDATMPIMIADLTIAKKKRRVVMEAPKNGFFYVLDARTGKLVNEPKPLIPVTWASRIDMQTGRPVQLAAAKYWLAPSGQAIVNPSPVGAHNFMPMSYSPGTGLVYVPVLNMPTLLKFDKNVSVGAVDVDWYYGLRHQLPFKGTLVAWDPVSQKARWQIDVGPPYEGGTLATGGNLVFQGTAAGEFVAYRADSGEKLWSMNVGSSIFGAPSTVEVDGTQLVIVAGGSGTTSALGLFKKLGGNPGGPSRLFAFRLNGRAIVPPVHERVEQFQKPTRPRPAPPTVRAGYAVWNRSNCDLCHGFEAVGGIGSVPDLRRSANVMQSTFEQIVIGGQFTGAGMPVYKDSIKPDEIESLRAYLVAQTWKAYDQQQSH
jgi:quinohemoprotein ethanol dehydrogenase